MITYTKLNKATQKRLVQRYQFWLEQEIKARDEKKPALISMRVQQLGSFHDAVIQTAGPDAAETLMREAIKWCRYHDRVDAYNNPEGK